MALSGEAGGTPVFTTFSGISTTTPLQITQAATTQVRRRGILIQNEGTVDVRVGGSTVTATTGGILLKGGATPPAFLSDEWGNQPLYAIAVAGGSKINVMEVY